MKKQIPYYFLITLMMLFAASCGKNGAPGPQGPPGPAGPAGPQGPPGANGTVIYSGTTVPASSIGATGDFYIDLSTGVFYGPKTATGWGTGFSLIGTKGAAGTNGTVIYSGTTIPAASTGAIGDFYIDLATGIFYGPKTNTGWGSGFSLTANALGTNFPIIINTILTPAILDTLEKHGTTINAGLTPPTINGIFLLSLDYVLFDNSGSNLAGKVEQDIKFEFSNQNSAAFTIQESYKTVNGSLNETGSSGPATYISGSGNRFTIYAQNNGIDVTSGIHFTTLDVISGGVGSNGITNLQWAYLLVSKGSDPNNVLEPVGSLRIVEDQDGLSATQSTFSVDPQKIQAIVSRPGNYPEAAVRR